MSRLPSFEDVEEQLSRLEQTRSVCHDERHTSTIVMTQDRIRTLASRIALRRSRNVSEIALKFRFLGHFIDPEYDAWAESLHASLVSDFEHLLTAASMKAIPQLK
jgi:hypothetical protein